MATPADELARLVDERAFSVDGSPYSWGDVLLSADLDGVLAQQRETTRRAVTAARRHPAEPETVREAATRFRRDRGLLSAEELEAWLARWQLEVGEWTEHLKRTLTEPFAEEPVDDADDELDRAVAVDLVCSGLLEREARRLGRDAALTTTDGGGDSRARIVHIKSSADAARAALASAADVEREIAARSLGWTRIDAELLELTDADAAREAALCVRVDGRSLAEVADDCGRPLERRSLYLQDVERERLPELLGAGPGELVGPVSHGGGYLLVHVSGRTRPSPDDPELRHRAREYLVRHAVEREVDARVQWA